MRPGRFYWAEKEGEEGGEEETEQEQEQGGLVLILLVPSGSLPGAWAGGRPGEAIGTSRIRTGIGTRGVGSLVQCSVQCHSSGLRPSAVSGRRAT